MYLKLFLFALIALCVVQPLMAQDERYLRKLYSGDLDEKIVETAEDIFKTKWQVESPLFTYDFEGDGKNEYFYVANKDDRTFLTILDHYKRQKGKYFLPAGGTNSSLYRLNIRRLSSKVVALIFYFYEGKTNYLNLYSTGRLYFGTIYNGDTSTLKVEKGPLFWEEIADGQKHYHQKRYHVGLFDYNNDGIKEIFVKYNNITRIFMYKDVGALVEI